MLIWSLPYEPIRFPESNIKLYSSNINQNKNCKHSWEKNPDGLYGLDDRCLSKMYTLTNQIVKKYNLQKQDNEIKIENSEFQNSEFENSEFENSEFENSEFQNSEFQNSEFQNSESEIVKKQSKDLFCFNSPLFLSKTQSSSKCSPPPGFENHDTKKLI